MGMFDRVYINCPKCGRLVEYQSKAGECALAEYDVHNVPQQIAAEMIGDHEYCQHCWAKIEFISQTKIVVIPIIKG